uniref:uncharacterized protein LOC117610839 n=1 Tax=Osmia lignaria TaxID=473952 RepID=UPI001478538D|nr:uncharacterized protein LOC117610839 [Osmia lignaria]
MEQMLHNSNISSSVDRIDLSVGNSASEELGCEIVKQSVVPSSSLQDKVKIAEIRYAAFFAEHNVALSIATDFLALMQDIGKDPGVLERIRVGRTKCTQIINNVLCVRETERIVDSIRNAKFSIHEDETSNSTNDKWLTLAVRYVEPCSFVVRTELLQLIHLDASDCSAEKIFKSFR